MNVHLTPHLEKLVQNKVKAGSYSSASEVVREALRLMQEQDELLLLRKEEIRKQIAEGYAALRRGESVDGEEAFRQLDKRHERHRRGR
jgi:antitoxin ParD1/3/4